MEIRVHKGERIKKTLKRRQQMNHCTPPKYLDKRSTFNKIEKLKKQLGYDYCGPKTSRFMLQKQKQFVDKAQKYYGSQTFTKKMTRFDKMRIKQQLGFNLEKNPVLKRLNKLEQMIDKKNVEIAFFSIKNF